MPFRAAGKHLVTFTLLLLMAFTCPVRAQRAALGNGGPGPIKADHLTVELVSAGPDIAAGGTQTLGFVFTLEDKWHIYWKNAGFAGFPPSVDWTLPKGITADDLMFPQPMRLPFQGAVDYGYEDNVTYPLVVHVTPNVKPGKDGKVHLAAHIKWLVCQEQCVPGTADLGIDLHLVPAGTAVSQQGTQVGPIANALKHIPQQPREGFSAKAVSDGKHIALTFVTGGEETDAEFYPLDEQLLQDNADQPIQSLPDGVRIYLTLLPNTIAPKRIHGVVELGDDESYQIIADVVSGQVSMPAASGSGNTGSAGGAASSSASEVTIVTAVALAFAGGMLLNLMPCVFPVLFLKALSLVQSSGEERQRSRVHGLVYTAGIIASFWAIVAVLLALRSGGARFGWGFQLQSPGFVGVLALLLFFFALSLSGVFELGLSLTSAGDSLTRKHGYAGSFFTGVLATVVATPCVGPFMGVAIGYALSQPALVTLLVFTALGLGLALPYLALTFFPSLMRWLPKPGAWMETLKQITAIPLYFTVIWLVYLYGRLFGSGDPFSSVDQAAMLLVALLVLSIGAWILGRWHRSRIATAVAFAFLATSVALPFALRPTQAELAQHGQAAMRNGGEAGSTWQPFTQAALDQARASGKSVFVDFTAAWCLSCQVNEKLVLHTDEVQAALQKSNFVLMRADWTQYDPAITNALSAVGRSGVPTYAIYPGSTTSKPDVLPEVLTKSIVLAAIQNDAKLAAK